MARGPEMLIALVACLKAGAAPLLLDPATPTPRQELALAAAGAPVLALSLERLGARLPMPAERVLLLDRDRDLVAAYEATDLDVPVDLDNLAYLVQTSGSTGTPRCVGVTQRAFSHCSLQWRAIHRLGPGDRSSWLAPPGASVSQVEIWPYLMAGASVHVAEPQIVTSPPDLRDWMIRSRITHAYVAMPLAEVLTSLDWGSDCALRVMSIGGDKVRRWAPAELPFEVGVNYGSAEACLVTHGWHPGAERTTSRTAGAEDRRGAPPIGRPGPGVRAYVLDDDLNLVPPGAVGELAVRTPEEARGYLGDPAKTALSFVPNPLGDPPGSRLYRTGDLASHRPDGLLDHRGRRDAQTKLRGHRVELAEIEAALLGHARVAGAVVVTRDDPAGVTRLVAYVVPRGPVAPDELRAFLAERLPEYMLPGSYVALDELPLNANRKVDRLSLPAPDWSGGRQRQPSAGPRNEIERAVVAIWVEQLRVPGVGIHDDFFQLGGDSLTGSLMVARLREQFGVDVSLRDVLLHPTPAGLAELVRGKPGRAPRRPLPTVVRRANGPAG
jgi:amino acid adenylation domain-containing protein